MPPIVLPGPNLDPLLVAGALVLRLPRHRDVPDLVRACNDPEIARQTRVPTPYGPGDARAFVADAHRWRVTGEALALVVGDAHGRLVGAVGLDLRGREDPVAVLGYWTAPWARGQGVARTGARALADWALAFGFRRLELLVAADNAASIAVARAAGFVPADREVGGWTRGGEPARDLLHYMRREGAGPSREIR